eukprot:EG_transcript_2617
MPAQASSVLLATPPHYYHCGAVLQQSPTWRWRPASFGLVLAVVLLTATVGVGLVDAAAGGGLRLRLRLAVPRRLLSNLPSVAAPTAAAAARSSVQAFWQHPPGQGPGLPLASAPPHPSSRAHPSRLLLPAVVTVGLLLASLLGRPGRRPRVALLATTARVEDVPMLPPPPPQARRTPYPRGTYDPEAARRYFARRPLRVAARALEIARRSAGFGFALLSDYQRGKAVMSANARQRAATLVGVLTSLGPTFIKVGQALSIRTDLLPQVYCEALTQLQDSVRPFPSDQAKRIIQEDLRVSSLSEVFVVLTPEPIASASLGQVYRGQLRQEYGGGDVAVKVQRPDMLETISLDLHLLRSIAAPVKELFRLNSDLAGVVDAWGTGFVDEIDYRKEAEHMAAFQEAIARTPLRDAVFAPDVVAAASSKKVLTTRWVEGERLELSNEADVSRLCSIAMNSYLTMMLESGVLHADPHPGNLLRSKDGRLCILDWGLVTSIPKNLQLSFIEHIAHLTSHDYAKVPEDLVKLGFVPPGMEEVVRSSGTVEVLTRVYSTWASGGGAAGKVGVVISEFQALAESSGGYVFRLPPYFAYIARAFLTLEGIGLKNDPQYAIVGECLPYISQRLLTDSDPRISGALSTFLYGAMKDSPDRAVDAERLEYLTSGFQSYSTATLGVTGTVSVEHSIRQIADILWAPEPTGTPLQRLVEEEVARLVGAGGRTVAAAVRESPAFRLAATVLDPFGVLRGATGLPLAAPPDSRDAAVLSSAAKLAEIAEQPAREAFESLLRLPPEEQREVLAAVAAVIWERREGATLSARRLAEHVVQETTRPTAA